MQADFLGAGGDLTQRRLEALEAVLIQKGYVTREELDFALEDLYAEGQEDVDDGLIGLGETNPLAEPGPEGRAGGGGEPEEGEKAGPVGEG